MAGSVYRVHPAIGLARVGNSEEFYLGPETMAGLPLGDPGGATGGLPIKPGTEAETSTSSDLRDAHGGLKRQAARFRIYQYLQTGAELYPRGDGTEIRIGSTIEGKKVVDIVWSVHLANKKANTYVLDEDEGIRAFDGGKHPALRNLTLGTDPDDPDRLKKLTIDPGPRAIGHGVAQPIRFDKATFASYWDGAAKKVQTLPDYPKSFPVDAFPQMNCPTGQGIDSLGELRTDDHGRLLVLGGYGRACGFYDDHKQPYPLNDDVNNDGWFDDVADGPVRATLVFDDGEVQEVQGVSWVVSTDPAYAPQILNVVSLWDDVLDTWVRTLGLSPDIYQGMKFLDTYKPSFDDHLLPIFRSASLQVWTTNLPRGAIRSHNAVGEIKPPDQPSETILGDVGSIIRDPNDPSASTNDRLMPLSLGDAGKSFLSMTFTQYFFLTQWNAGNFSPGPGPVVGPGEFLDRAVLVNCLGGRFNPGIDLTFIVRDPDLYVKDWQTSGTGPFRINPKALNYAQARPDRPFLSGGYIPLQTGPAGLEPGDASKFMAIPWHTDYNSCATHQTSPRVPGNTILYWSWPAQRPVAIYAAKDVVQGKLGAQRFSVRGKGTETQDNSMVGRYQVREDVLKHWQDIGVVLQGQAIDGTTYDPSQYLEVASLLDDSGNKVEPWPNRVNPTPAP